MSIFRDHLDSDLPGAPSRAVALALIDSLKDYDRGRVDIHLAHRCWEIYGYPELSPDAIARWCIAASERSTLSPPTHSGETKAAPTADPSYGFGKR